MSEHLPHDPEIEAAVLGAMILHEDAPETATEILDPKMFYLEPHKIIFKAMSVLLTNGDEVNELTLRRRLTERDLLDRVGGALKISELIDAPPDVINVEHHAGIIRRLWIQREKIRAGRELVEGASKGDEDTVREAEEKVRTLSSVSTASPVGHLRGDLLGDFFGEKIRPSVPIIHPLIHSNEFFVVSAKAGIGKSPFLMWISLALAAGMDPFPGWTVPESRPVIYIDGELPRGTSQSRLKRHAAALGVDARDLPFLLISKQKLENRGVWRSLHTPEGNRELRYQIERMDSRFGRPPLVIFDSLNGVTDMDDLDNYAVKPWNENLMALREDGIETGYAHHQGHNHDRIRGASELLGPVDVALSLSPIERGQFRIKVNKDRGYRFPERLAMRLIGDPPHDPLALEIFDAEAGPAANRRAENIARIDEHLGQHAEESPSVIVKACGIRKSEGLALIRELVEDGHYVERSEGRGKMVALPDTFDEGDGDLFQ